jgi:hypothetical protein
MVDIADVDIEYVISQGRLKEAADLLRKRGGSSGKLFKTIADLIDPDKLQRMGRPVKKDTCEYSAKQRFMMYQFYYLRAYYKAHMGWKNPAEVAKGYVLDAHKCGKAFFEEAHTRHGKSEKRRVDSDVACLAQNGIDFKVLISQDGLGIVPIK